jgi:catechol 2,3-dioxygenase-like lactoylglutathione lyase family enzyme
MANGRAGSLLEDGMAAVFSDLVIDCADPERLAEFWCEVLGWQRVGVEDDGAIEIAAVLGAAPSLLFEPVPEPKTLKNRLHVDVRPSGVDQDTELDRLLELGATRVDIGQGEQTWVVLADPEGNEFCLLRGRAEDQ